MPNRPADVEIYVNMPNKSNVRLSVSPRARVCDVKLMINDVTGIDMRDIYLVYASKVLDDNLTIADYMIGNYAYIQLFVRLRGGSRKSKKKTRDSDDEEVRELSDTDISGTATHLPRSTYSSRYISGQGGQMIYC